MTMYLCGYSARYMDSALGRFNTVDLHAENYYAWSPYHYAANNPLIVIDPDWRDWYTSTDGLATMWKKGSTDIEGHKSIGANYTQNIDDHTYTQDGAKSITYIGVKEGDFVVKVQVLFAKQ